jgi:hypothetical protein
MGGGGLPGALLGGASSGLGAVAGSNFGFANPVARYLGGSQFFQGATTALGAMMGSSMGSAMARPYGTAQQPITPNIPSYEEMRARAVSATQRAFANAGLPAVFEYDSPFRRIMADSRIDIFNRSRFPSVKEALRRRLLERQNA